MQVLIVHCHPEPRSFNAALTGTARETLEQQGHTVEVADLYEEGFDPVEGPSRYPSRADPSYFSALTEQRHGFETGCLPGDVQAEIRRLERADLVIFQFPLWWHAQPALLKGWFDRVFVYGGLYSGGMRFDRGRFAGRRAICSVTTGAPEATFSRQGRSGHMVRLMWPIHRSLYYLGYAVLAPQVAYGIQGGGLTYQSEGPFRRHLESCKTDWARRLEHLADESAIPFTGWDDWDETGVLKVRHPANWL